MRYCDGGSFTGNNDTISSYNNVSIYYRGYRILQNALSYLYDNLGLDNATDVLVSGCSAGGLSTWLHADDIRKSKYIPDNANFMGIPESGFFLMNEGGGYKDQMIWLYRNMNSSIGVNQDCYNFYVKTGQDELCIFAESVAPFIQSKMFPLQSRFDPFQLGHNVSDYKYNDTFSNKYGDYFTNIWFNNYLLSTFGLLHSGFCDSCVHHCGEWNNIEINGYIASQAMYQWYHDLLDNNKRIFFQNETFPCNDVCCFPKGIIPNSPQCVDPHN